MANQRVLFGGYDTAGTYGLWISDGAAVGTTELSVANAGLNGVAFGASAQLGASVLFAGANLAGNIGLWVTDGTGAGTTELAVAGASTTFGGMQPSAFAVLGKQALFAGYDAANTPNLWTTDGSAAGTKEMQVAGQSALGLAPSGMTKFGAAVFFQGTGSDGALGLWKKPPARSPAPRGCGRCMKRPAGWRRPT